MKGGLCVLLCAKDVLHGAEVVGAPGPGDLVAVLYLGGRTIVTGFPLCGESVRGLEKPYEGQTVVLGGQVWEADSGYFQDVAGFHQL